MVNTISKSIKNKFYGLAHIGVLAVSAAVIVSSVQAHPDPDNPFDDTIFAKIEAAQGMKVALEVIVDEDQGITSPLKGIPSSDSSNNLMYVIDQVGLLWVVDLSTTNTNTAVVDFATLVDLVDVGGLFGALSKFDERGFLGFAFHPDYLNSTKPGFAKIYTYTSEKYDSLNTPTFPTTVTLPDTPDHQAVISEWTVVDPTQDVFTISGERKILMRIDEPQFNHDGGDILFDENNLLYIPLGDGGAADDQGVGHTSNGNAQDNTNPLGTILRIDPFGSGGSGPYGIPTGNLNQIGALGEIYAYGFRNPYRISIDSVTGDLYVADVGQNDIEELNIVNAPGNYGWRLKEGTTFFIPNGTDPGFATLDDICGVACSNVIDPIAQYDTHHEGHSIIGGFVYHGAAIPQLQNRYVFADFSGFGFNFAAPSLNNYGRLLILNKTTSANDLHKIKNLQFDYRLGPVNNEFIDERDHTLAILGFGIEKDGEIYVLGSATGTPDKDNPSGVVLKLTPVSKKK